MRKLNTPGFTIIELLIATVVFSVVLLIVTTGIVQFGRIYYKGVIQSRTQERARAIIEDIAQNAEFSGGNLQIAPNRYCVGNRAYTYLLNQRLTNSQRVLVARSGSGCSSYAPMNGSPLPALPSDAVELAGENMILLNLTITQTGDLFTATVRLAYTPDPLNDLTVVGPTGTCKSIQRGGQFCAVSELSTTVNKRLK